MEIVKGNDIKVVWAITKTVDNVNIPEDLSTATNIRFKVWCSGTLISVPDYSVSGNEITFTIKGSVQRTGEYSFEVSYSKGYDARVVYKDAFLVVDLACQANYVKPDDIQVTTLQFYSSISSLYLWQLLDVKKSTTDNSVDKTFDKFYLGYDAKLKQWYGMKIPEETFKLEDMWKALDAENEIIPKSHLDLTGLATQEWVKQQIDNIPTGGGDVDINVVTQLVKDIIGKWFKEDENSDLYVVNKIVDGAEVGRNFYTYGGITAMGKSDGGGGGTGGASSLGQLTNVGDWADTTPTEDRLFIQKAGATHWSSMRLTDIKVDLSNYYTKSETNSAISKAVVDAVTPVQNLLNNHINNADIHVTLAEKTLWNKIAGYFAEDSNQDIFVTNKSDGTPRGFYSNSFVSALGLNTGGGGGGMDEALLWSILGDGDNPDKQIAVSHLTKALSPYSTTSQMNTAISEAVKGYIPLSQKGRAGGVVPLDNDGLISSMYLPSYVDDVLEYSTFSALPATGESGKIYVTLDTNLTYRWSGTSYVEISKSLALGETADTAYAGNKGKENRDSINRLKNATFWGATYQANGNVYGTFNGTEIYLTNKIETPKIKIGDIFLEYDAERNAIKGVKYNSDGAEEMANFYMTGGITALGISSSGGISFTLQDLADTNISNPQDKQALVYDAASQKWINGQAIGGGDISLNGTVYKPVNGIITLPGLYEKVAGGTSSQFLKADGSVDGNVYALAYNGNQNKTQHSQYSRFTNYFNVIDRRDDTPIPNSYETHTISAFFNMGNGMPDGNWWSGFHVRGWGDGYCTWELIGPSSTNNTAYNLRYRTGIGDTWGDWKMIMTDVECDKNYVKKTGDTMTGPLIAPWILGRKLNMSRVATEYSAGTGAVINYFGTDTIMDNQSSSITGTLKIRLPITWTNTMGVYKIMLYEYNGRGSSEITVSFYNYLSSQSYYNYSYQLNGAFEGAVRIAHDGSGCCILLGDTSYNWNYIKVYVYQVFNGHDVPSNYVDQPYNISIITSEAGLSKVTSIPKTSMNRHDDNYIRAINKNGFYGMGKVGNIDTDWIRTTKPGLIPFEPGTSSDNSMLGSETWQFGKIFGAIIYGQRVCSLTHNLYLGSSGNSGWVYCQDICSANGAAEAYWSIRTNGSAVFTNLTSKNKITGDINGNADGYATYLPTKYNGGTQANPQTYFNQNMGLRVAMTGIGFGGPWSDTLWINGYSGGDVLPMCALHFIRNGTPRFGISTQKSNGTSYGTNYEVWTAYNSNKSDAAWSCSTLNANGRVTCADVYSSSWLRTVGQTGWYSESYGGGWYMTDSTWLRAYNNKQIYTGSTSADAIHTAGGMNASGRIYAGSYMQAMGGLNIAGILNSTGAYGFNIYAAFHGNGQHGGIEIGASDNVFGMGVHSDDYMYWWWTNSGSVGSSSNKSYIMAYGGGTWQFTGNIGATGGITAMTSSDENLKNRLDYEVDYASKLLLLGKVFDFTYNDKALSRKDKYADRNVHTGLSWQKVRNILPTVCGMDKDGYGYINYISPDLISLIAGATQLNTLGIQSILNRTKSLEERVKILERRNEQLELKIKLIQR